ncbi:MAG: archease [Acidimicrobiales bacterium]
MTPFRFVPHTADIAVELSAADEAGLREAGIEALRELLVGTSDVRPLEERPIEPGPGEPGERLVRFLGQVLSLYDTERFVPARAGGAGVLGEPFDPARHRAEREVKAVTHHGAAVLRDARGLRVTIVFDV